MAPNQSNAYGRDHPRGQPRQAGLRLRECRLNRMVLQGDRTAGKLDKVSKNEYINA